MQTETTTHTEPELPLYRAVASSTDYENGIIEIRITRSEVELRSLIVSGRAGLNETHIETVGYSPDENVGFHVPIKLLVLAILGGLLFFEASARGDISQ